MSHQKFADFLQTFLVGTVFQMYNLLPSIVDIACVKQVGDILNYNYFVSDLWCEKRTIIYTQDYVFCRNRILAICVCVWVYMCARTW